MSSASSTRHPVTWYLDGQEQDPRTRRPGRLYPTDGPADHTETAS